MISLDTFLASIGSLDFKAKPLAFAVSGFEMAGRIYLSSPPTCLDAHNQIGRSNYRAVSCHCSHLGSDPGLDRLSPANLRSPTPRRHLAVQTIVSGSGISTRCPSPTTFVLGLGPTNPERTSLPRGNLRLTACENSHSHCATHADIHTPSTTEPSSRSTFTADGTLPYQTTTGEPVMESVASVPSLSPAEFSAQIHLTSELLRTLSMMAASEPTSWLSMQIAPPFT